MKAISHSPAQRDVVHSTDEVHIWSSTLLLYSSSLCLSFSRGADNVNTAHSDNHFCDAFCIIVAPVLHFALQQACFPSFLCINMIESSNGCHVPSVKT